MSKTNIQKERRSTEDDPENIISPDNGHQRNSHNHLSSLGMKQQQNDGDKDGGGGGRGGKLSVQEVNFAVPSQKGAQQHVQEHHGTKSWRLAVFQIVHHKTVQRILCGLLLLDVLILFTELFLLAVYPQCSLIERDCIACCTDNGTSDTSRLLAQQEGDNSDICEVGYANIGQSSCDPHNWEKVHEVENILFAVTVAILSVFMLENIIELIVIGPYTFCRQIWYASDFIVIATSLSLELIFHYANEGAQETLGGFLVFFRLWRFLRISHGLVEVTSELAHQQYDELIEYAQCMESILKKHEIALPQATKQVKRLTSDNDDTISSGYS
jgi:hypothetical protein